ncbi:MAG: hypothetical protein AB7U79_05275 [Candidatus Izemoplasmatales bacterium]
MKKYLIYIFIFIFLSLFFLGSSVSNVYADFDDIDYEEIDIDTQ